MTYAAELRPVVDDVLGPWFAGAGDGRVAADAGALWDAVAGLGWPKVGVDEPAGGVGGDLADVAELAAGIGRHAVPLPLLETCLAGWVLASAGMSADLLGDEPAVAVALPHPVDGAVSGAVRGVRFLPAATHAVLVVPGHGVVVRRRSELVCHAYEDLAGEPVGDLVLDGLALRDDDPTTAGLAGELVARAALLRAAALGGCVDRAARLVTDHVAVREQFGRPLLAQQAVAHGVAAIACERDLIAGAVEAALADPSPASFAASRATASRSAGEAARVAHQLMGAMGITREHRLQLLTRRIWAWRDADGTQRKWEQSVGEHVLAGRDDDALWDLVTSSSASWLS